MTSSIKIRTSAAKKEQYPFIIHLRGKKLRQALLFFKKIKALNSKQFH